MGKPVVCTAVGAMRDFVKTGEQGEVITPGDTQALAAAIAELLGNKEYRDKIAAENAGYVRKNFTQAVIAEKLGNYIRLAVQNR